jgi:heme/copper-type cytochrome/quinol oxidase subunit 2
MLAAYVIQAILMTFYIPALLIVRFDWRRYPKRATSAATRTLSAVKHSTVSFMNASLVFGIAMLSASLISLARRETPTSSAVALMVLMPFNSILPVALLQFAASDMLRRSRGMLLSWALITGLMIAVLAMTRLLVTKTSEEDDQNYKQLDWQSHCMDQHDLIPFLGFSQVFSILLILGTGGFVVASYIRSLQNRPSASWMIRLVGGLWWTAVVAAFLAMWLCLGWFIYFQNKKNSMAGDENKNTEWSFGQILAVGTWVPVVVEFAYVWWERPLEALNGRLMDPYEVKEVYVKTGGYELIQRRETV